MSRAFVKEEDPTGGSAELPDRPISPHPNLVTRRGLRLIEGKVAEFERQLAAAPGDGEVGAQAARELRYWAARLATAQVEAPSPGERAVRFGTTVTGVHADGSQTSLTIVGEDEADPAEGRIAWTAPVARALLGAEPGEVRRLPKGEFEVVAVEAGGD